MPSVHSRQLTSYSLNSKTNIERPQTPVRRMIPSHEPLPPFGLIAPSPTQPPTSPDDDVFTEDLAKLSVSRPAIEDDHLFISPAWVHEEPSTWPVSHMPYIDAPGQSRPTHISHLVYHVHYKTMAARTLQILMHNVLQEAGTDEKKRAIEYVGYLKWPFNITSSGHWKKESGMTTEEIEIWKNDMEEQGAQMEQRAKDASVV